MQFNENHKKILIIGSEPSLVGSLEWFLETRGYSVVSILDYNEAVAALNCMKNGIDSFGAVLIEAGNSVINDFELIGGIKKIMACIPVMVLGASDSRSLAAVYLERGADGFMDIPFSPLELEARVNALIRRSCMAAKPVRETN